MGVGAVLSSGIFIKRKMVQGSVREILTTAQPQLYHSALCSRPLKRLSPDTSDVKSSYSWTFIGVPLLDLPDETSSTNLRLLLARIGKKNQVFWKRWSRGYLHHLQSRPKLYSQKTHLQVGDCLVIHAPQSSILLG
ncbi:hypothetical protein TNCV_3956461 [Trichonephila clavipes]|nr:hypothetical protein TNCV_3956461 [Trichonephila clavipes]